ncbi:hypothetical protein DFH08DRAFT_1025608 [Mycena albidolilacea]|uniref:Uncharacterized protein n=1 Tax=Mycena albidolilacea TaxID=1033008 RepID=A0AAD7AMZ1_9AGAR|nr:hypothetical protein DFH08DRAFT_1025608 [Mycena albidolilacea]
MKTDGIETQLGGRLKSAQDCSEILRNGECIRYVGGGGKAEVKNKEKGAVRCRQINYAESKPGTTQIRIGRSTLPRSAPKVGDQTTSESIPGVARDARALVQLVALALGCEMRHVRVVELYPQSGWEIVLECPKGSGWEFDVQGMSHFHTPRLRDTHRESRYWLSKPRVWDEFFTTDCAIVNVGPWYLLGIEKGFLSCRGLYRPVFEDILNEGVSTRLCHDGEGAWRCKTEFILPMPDTVRIAYSEVRTELRDGLTVLEGGTMMGPEVRPPPHACAYGEKCLQVQTVAKCELCQLITSITKIYASRGLFSINHKHYHASLSDLPVRTGRKIDLESKGQNDESVQ